MMENPWEVVVVSSNVGMRQHVAGMLSRLGIDPICVSSLEQYRQIPKREDIGLVFCDSQMKDGNYRDVLSAASAPSPHCNPNVVMMSELSNREEYQQARDSGLFDVIPSPCRPTDIEWMVIQTRRKERAQPGLFQAAALAFPLLHKRAKLGG